MTEEKTAIEEEKNKQKEVELHDITADDLAAGTFCALFRNKYEGSVNYI